MSASILNFLRQRAKQPAPWANDELAELYRVVDILSRAGIAVETDVGLSDEGDPWFVFCRADTGEVIAHFARIDGQFVAASVVIDQTFRGRNFREIIDSLVAHQPLLIPRPGGNSKLYLHPSVILTAFIATALLYSQKGEWDGSDFPGHGHRDGDAAAHDGTAGANKESVSPHHFWFSRSHPDTPQSKSASVELASTSIFEQGVTLASIIGIAISVIEGTVQDSDTTLAGLADIAPPTPEPSSSTPTPPSEGRIALALIPEATLPGPSLPSAAAGDMPPEPIAHHAQEKDNAPTPHFALAFTDMVVQTTEFVPVGNSKPDKAELPNILDYGRHHLLILAAVVGEDSVTLPAPAPTSAPSASPSNKVSTAVVSSYPTPSTESGSHKDGATTASTAIKSTVSDDASKSSAQIVSAAQNDVKTSDHVFFQVSVVAAQSDPTLKSLDPTSISALTPNAGQKNDPFVALSPTTMSPTTMSPTTIPTSGGASAGMTTKTTALTSATDTMTAIHSMNVADATVLAHAVDVATATGTPNTTVASSAIATITNTVKVAEAAPAASVTTLADAMTIMKAPAPTSAITTGTTTLTSSTDSVASALNAAGASTGTTNASSLAQGNTPFNIITGFLNDTHTVATVPITPSDTLKAALKVGHSSYSGAIAIVVFESASLHTDIFQLTPGVLFVEQHQVNWTAATTSSGTSGLSDLHSVALTLANGGGMTLLGVLSDSHLLTTA